MLGVVPAGLSVRHKGSTFYRRGLIASLAVAALIVTGCAHRYVITLTNGNQIAAKSKPQLKNGEAYVYKDLQGKVATVPAGKVREIAPASMAKDQKGPFIPSPAN